MTLTRCNKCGKFIFTGMHTCRGRGSYEKSNGWIMVEHPNGYYGCLKGKNMSIFKGGREVLHTYSATPTNAEELWDVLEDMDEFMDLMRQEHS